MLYVTRDREGKDYIINESSPVKFLYGTVGGRFLIKLFSMPFISKSVGFFLDSSFSIFMIKRFIKKNNIDMNLYEEEKYNSFNEFFTRKMKSDKLDINYDGDILISPCNAKLTCYEINDECIYRIKDSYYKISDLLNGNPIYKDYDGGYMLVFRLCADDYHRYIYIDNGTKEENVFVKGVLNTVRPIALEHFDIYKRNSREYSVLRTENFGDVVQVEVGALLVGKISNLHQDYTFKRGEEKGMFEFGGSTIVLLVKKDIVLLDGDILKNSSEDAETLVTVGSRIGKRVLKKKI